MTAEAPDKIVSDLFEKPAGRRAMVRGLGGDGIAYYAMHYLRLATPACHRRWYDAFHRADRLLFLAPRSHGKSISAGRVLVGHTVVTNRNARILLISKTKGAASKTARLVRRDLEKNERIQLDWTSAAAGGPFREKGLPWTDSLFYVHRTLDARDPTVEAVGVGGSITGGRFDLIILDDPVDDENTRTSARRRRTRDWFYGTVLPLLDTGGRVVVIGTRKHADDLYNTLEQDPTFDIIRDGAFVDGMASVDLSRVRWVERVNPRTGRVQLVDAVYEPEPGQAEPRVLWPEKWSLRDLLLKLRSMGSLLFLREMQNDITDDGSSPFKMAWLKRAIAAGSTRGFLPWGVDPETGEEHPRCAGLVVWQSWDTTLVEDEESAQEADNDFTVGLTWGLEWKTGRRFLLRAVRRRGLTPTQMIDLIKAEAALFPQRIAVVVESNSFGRLYVLGLKHDRAALPVYGHHTDKKKRSLYEGVPAMAALYENDLMVLPYASSAHLAANEIDPRPLVDELVREHHGLGTEPHDDLPMCAWFADVWIRRWIAAEEKRRSGRGTVKAQAVA